MKTALITIGSTREYIDPVRYISNESSGKQGMSLIKGLLKKNYKIICLHGYLQVKPIISKKIKYIFTPNAVNKSVRSNVSTQLKAIDKLIKDKKVDESMAKLKQVMSILHKSTQKKIMHLNKASRTISKLQKDISAISK